MSSLIKTASEHDLSHEKMTDLISRLSQRLAGRVEKAYVFGSAARGDFSKDSDIDLILLQKTTKPFTTRALEFSDLFDTYPRLDILVYTPEEFSAQLSDANVGFWKSVKETLKQIV